MRLSSPFAKKEEKKLFTEEEFCGILMYPGRCSPPLEGKVSPRATDEAPPAKRYENKKGGLPMLPKSFKVGDTLVMKKDHACGKGAVRFSVLRVGSDIRILCLSCGHDVTVPRIKLEKNIKSVIPKEDIESTKHV